jgi:hypothetical protein
MDELTRTGDPRVSATVIFEAPPFTDSLQTKRKPANRPKTKTKTKTKLKQ